jgi:hydrogenase-4 component F
VSELLVLAGGIEAGETAIAAVAAGALALGFLGLLHALLEGVIGPADKRPRAASRSERPIAVLTGAFGAGLLALTVAGVLLPGSAFIDALAKGAL